MKSYGQFCALARSLDIVGDRWTLLLVRDLLAKDATFGEVQDGLPGIATNILTERLRHLEENGLAWRRRDGRQTLYGLTDRGRELTDAIHALIRWGTPEMARGANGDLVRVEWLPVALGALIRRSADSGCIAFHVDGEIVRVDVGAGRAALSSISEPGDVAIETTVEGALALISGAATLRSLLRSGEAGCRQARRAEQLIRSARAGSEGSSAP